MLQLLLCIDIHRMFTMGTIISGSFDQWFKYPNGTLIKLSSDSTTYIINNGLKSVIPSFVILSRGLNAGSTITVSPTELYSLDQGPIYGPADNTVIKVSTDPSGKLFCFCKQ